MGFVMAAIMVSAIGSLVWLIDKAAGGSVLAGVVAIGLVTVTLGAVINTSIKRPCHQYETRMMFNAATKTMMPSRVCVLRGEWVEEDHDNQ